MVRVCDGNTLPVHDNKFYLLRSYANTAHEIWDVTNPSAPRPVRTVAGGTQSSDRQVARRCGCTRSLRSRQSRSAVAASPGCLRPRYGQAAGARVGHVQISCAVFA